MSLQERCSLGRHRIVLSKRFLGFAFPSLREFLSAPCSVNKNRIPSEKHIQIHRNWGPICMRNMSMLRPMCISVYHEIGMIFYRAHSLCFSIPTCRSLKSRRLPPKLIPEWRFPGSCNSSSSNNYLAYFPWGESSAKASYSQLVSSLHSPSLGCHPAKSKQRQPTLTGAKGLTKTCKCIMHVIHINT